MKPSPAKGEAALDCHESVLPPSILHTYTLYALSNAPNCAQASHTVEIIEWLKSLNALMLA